MTSLTPQIRGRLVQSQKYVFATAVSHEYEDDDAARECSCLDGTKDDFSIYFVLESQGRSHIVQEETVWYRRCLMTSQRDAKSRWLNSLLASSGASKREVFVHATDGAVEAFG